MTRYLTLYPGDVICMGTDDPTLDRVAGYTVDVRIDGIGTLRIPAIASAPGERRRDGVTAHPRRPGLLRIFAPDGA